jgi:hypothetical protein
MSKYIFDIPVNEGDLIIVNAIIADKFEFRLALDTAATHTTIDSNVLYLSGYELKNSKGEKEVETSNGIIIVELFDVEQLDSLGVSKHKFEVQVYDFLAHNVSSEYDGVIGLNFLKDHKFCIDMRVGEITIS